VDVVELIHQDHAEITHLFERVAVTTRDDPRLPARAFVESRVMRLTARLVAAVRVHNSSEERVVYEMLKLSSAPRLRAFALAAPHEHETIDITLDKLLVHRPGDEFAMIVKVAHDLFEMHAIDEEEAEILPLMTEVIPPAERARLGAAMLAERARIRPAVMRLVGLPVPA
jgi:hypothetical protein